MPTGNAQTCWFISRSNQGWTACVKTHDLPSSFDALHFRSSASWLKASRQRSAPETLVRPWSAINHTNIISIHEIDETDSGHFSATEFIEGQTLRERESSTPLKLTESLDIATQIASALAAAHAAGIVHRDIKPENVMLRHDGIVKVLDFGLAKLTAPASSDSIDNEAPTLANVKTDPGTVVGTAIYMSPEQARGMP